MKKALILIFAHLLLNTAPVSAASEEQALAVIKSALPHAPAGWVVAGEQSGQGHVQSRTGVRGVEYTRSYRRVEKIGEDRKQLDAVVAESSRRNREAAKPQIDELIRQQTVTSLALRKAVRRRNAAEEKRLNEELEKNGARMRALHEEADGRVARDVAPYLLRDAEASISIALDQDAAELSQGESLPVTDAAFALYRPGSAAGVTGWREGVLLVLYGDWRSRGSGVFQAQVPPGRGLPVSTVRITITGDLVRAQQLLKQLDLKAVLSLMQS